MRILRIASGIVLILSLLAGTAAAESDRVAASPHLCIVPVLRGSPTEADVFAMYRMTSSRDMVDGLPRPVIYPMNRGGVWTVSDERAFEPFGGEFPRSSIYDRFAVEAANGRIIGINSDGVFAAARGARRFEKLIATRDPGSMHRPAAVVHVPRRDATLIGAANGLFELRGNSLGLLTDKVQLGSGYLPKLIDLPEHRAVLVTAAEGLIALWHDDNRLEVVRSPQKDQAQILSAHEIGGSRLLLRTSTGALMVDSGGAEGQTRTRSLSLLKPQDKRIRSHDLFSVATGTYLVFGRPGDGPDQQDRGLERLGADGFTSVPGPAIRRPSSGGQMQDIPSRGVVLVEGEDSLHLFDGESLATIPGSGPAEIGRSVRVQDAPSIGKVLLSSQRGVFELTPERALIPIPVPATDEVSWKQFAEMTPSKAVIVMTAGGVFAIDGAGRVHAIPGGENLGLEDERRILGLIPIRHELLFGGRSGLYLVLDRRIAGDAACAPAEQPRPAPSTVCIRPIDGADDRSMGPISAWAAAPTRDRLLIGGREGLLQLGRDRTFSRVPGTRHGTVHALVPLPWAKQVFISGWDSYTAMDDAGHIRPVNDATGYPRSGFSAHTVLPSLRIVAFRLSGSFDFYLTPDGRSANRFADRVSASHIAEAPWLESAVAATTWGLKQIAPDGTVRDLPIPQRDRGITGLRPSGLHAIARFRSILVYARQSWKRITPDFAIVDVPDLSQDAHSILAVHDSGQGAVLLGTSRGLYTIDENGRAAEVPGTGPGAIRALQHSTALGALLAAGEHGLFRVVDGQWVTAVPQGDALTIGAVFRLLDVPWAQATLVEAARGTFVIESDGVMRRIEALQADAMFARLSVFPELERAYVLGKGFEYKHGSVHELGRTSSNGGACIGSL